MDLDTAADKYRTLSQQTEDLVLQLHEARQVVDELEEKQRALTDELREAGKAVLKSIYPH